MQIKATTKYGGQSASNGKPARDGFKLAFEAELTQEQVVEAAAIGLATLNYACASRVNTALGAKKNADVEFTDANARIVEATIAKHAAENGFFLSSGFKVVVNATRHIHGAGSGGVDYNAAALARLAAKESDADANALTEYLALCGYEGETHGADGEFHPDAIAASAKRIKQKHEEALKQD